MIAACELAKRRYLELLAPLREGAGARGGARLGRLLGAHAARRRSRRSPTASTRPRSAGSTTTAQPRRPAAVKVKVDDRGRRDHDRPHRLERRGADGLQLPLRGNDGVRHDVHHADDLPRRGRLPRVRPAERGDAAAGQRDRAEGLDLQPELPARVLRALLPGAARGRPRPPRARAGRAGARSPPATRRTSTSSPTRASTRRSRSTGSTSRSTRARTAAARAATASTRSTA